jgi:hypothetical protein
MESAAGKPALQVTLGATPCPVLVNVAEQPRKPLDQFNKFGPE